MKKKSKMWLNVPNHPLKRMTRQDFCMKIEWKHRLYRISFLSISSSCSPSPSTPPNSARRECSQILSRLLQRRGGNEQQIETRIWQHDLYDKVDEQRLVARKNYARGLPWDLIRLKALGLTINIDSNFSHKNSAQIDAHRTRFDVSG